MQTITHLLTLLQTVNNKLKVTIETMAMQIIENNYKQGSQEPIKEPNIPRVYGYQFCPYVERVLLVIQAKQLRCEVLNVDINSKPQWFFSKNQLGKVPALEIDDNKLLTESTIIAEYFDEEFEGTRKLQPKHAYERCRQKVFFESFSSVFSAFYKIYRSNEPLLELLATIETGLQTLEKELKSRATKFIGGNDYPSMVDYLIWPWIERLPAIISIVKKEQNWQQYLQRKLPLLVQYMNAMNEDSAVKQVCYSDQIHEEYFLFHIKLIRGEQF